MLKRTISYSDFNGVNRTENYYFHLSAEDLVDVMAMFEDKDGKTIDPATLGNSKGIRLVIDLIASAFGLKSEDGLRFEKSEALKESFIQSAAFDALIARFLVGTDDPTDFVMELLPKEFVAKLAAQAEQPQATNSFNIAAPTVTPGGLSSNQIADAARAHVDRINGQ